MFAFAADSTRDTAHSTPEGAQERFLHHTWPHEAAEQEEGPHGVPQASRQVGGQIIDAVLAYCVGSGHPPMAKI